MKTPEHAWFVYHYLLVLVFVGIGTLLLLLPHEVWN